MDGTESIEDEVADAVENGGTMVLLRGLECVGVVTYNEVGSGIDKAVGINHLLENGTKRVFPTPMKCDDNIV